VNDLESKEAIFPGLRDRALQLSPRLLPGR